MITRLSSSEREIGCSVCRNIRYSNPQNEICVSGLVETCFLGCRNVLMRFSVPALPGQTASGSGFNGVYHPRVNCGGQESDSLTGRRISCGVALVNVLFFSRLQLGSIFAG